MYTAYVALTGQRPHFMTSAHLLYHQPNLAHVYSLCNPEETAYVALKHMYTAHVHSTCIQHMYTAHVYSTCIKHMYTAHVYSTCTQHMYTAHVYSTCIQHMYTAHVCSTCIQHMYTAHVGTLVPRVPYCATKTHACIFHLEIRTLFACCMIQPYDQTDPLEWSCDA
jgi:hypothetical protein